MLRAWEEIQSALVGVVATKVANALADIVRGFKEQFGARDDDTRVIQRTSETH
jgi:hypothetical protein